MGTIKGGKIVCDRCGDDCTKLYGFAMTVDRVAHTHNEQIKEIVSRVDRKYGKHDFIICWDCTIEMMGVLSLAQKAQIDKQLKKEAKDAKGDTQKVEKTGGKEGSKG